MNPKSDLKLVILCLSTPVCFLEGQAEVELVLSLRRALWSIIPWGLQNRMVKAKGEQESISIIPNHCSGIKQEAAWAPH